MFKKARNIETAFQSIRLYTLVVVVGSLVTSSIIIWRCLRLAEEAQRKVYILSSGKALEAVAGDRKENISVEARDHVQNLHTLFFTLAPDEKLVTEHIKRALYLVDESGSNLYDNLKESAYYANIISSNISQEIRIDSVGLDTQQYPIYFKCWASLRLIRTSRIVTRSMITQGWLRNVSRSDNNSHGLLAERWSILEDREIKTENR